MQWIEAAQVPLPLRAGYQTQRAAIKQEFERSGKDMKRDGGVLCLSGDAQEAANHFFDDLNSFGIFPVRNGELESWLPALGIGGYGTQWAISILEKLGSDSSSETYVRPGSEDVWQFVRLVVAWIQNTARKGAP